VQTEDNSDRRQSNAQNCAKGKTCDIKGPSLFVLKQPPALAWMNVVGSSLNSLPEAVDSENWKVVILTG